MSADIYDGAMNGNVFLAIEQALVPTLEIGNVVIMDKLPPYTPVLIKPDWYRSKRPVEGVGLCALSGATVAASPPSCWSRAMACRPSLIP